jgi:hypothetical protein
VRVEDVDIGELEARQGEVGAFDEVFAAGAEVVDFIAGGGERGVVGAPVYLRIALAPT